MIGGKGKTFSEVYDSISRKFTIFSLKLPCVSDRTQRDTNIQLKTESFNNKVVVFYVRFLNNLVLTKYLYISAIKTGKF